VLRLATPCCRQCDAIVTELNSVSGRFSCRSYRLRKPHLFSLTNDRWTQLVYISRSLRTNIDVILLTKLRENLMLVIYVERRRICGSDADDKETDERIQICGRFIRAGVDLTARSRDFRGSVLSTTHRAPPTLPPLPPPWLPGLTCLSAPGDFGVNCFLHYVNVDDHFMSSRHVDRSGQVISGRRVAVLRPVTRGNKSAATTATAAVGTTRRRRRWLGGYFHDEPVVDYLADPIDERRRPVSIWIIIAFVG
jgi:hypothetical protein